jgi:tetratricopeptide (TPR) repeat protein
MAAVFAAAVVATATIHARMPTRTRAVEGEMFLPRPEVARAFALGFEAVLADYYWFQAIQTIGGKHAPVGKGPLLAQLIDLVTTLDPWVGHPYRFAAVWLTDDHETVLKANDLLRRGIAYHPDDWRHWFYLGFNHFFFLDERAEAAEALESAIRLSGSPLYLRRLVARLKSATGGLDVAEDFLRNLLRDADEEKAIEAYTKALDEIATERAALPLDAARERYRERHGKDIASVDDLVSGPSPVLPKLPPEPHGGAWKLDPYSNQIVSDVIGHRYEPKLDPVTRGRVKAFREGRGSGAVEVETKETEG